MDPLVAESTKLENLDFIGKPLLKSLRKQKREVILCDVSIKCRNKQLPAHRCVLYAVSKYCRTLFTGSLPPIYRNGMAIMDLDLFSYDTVQYFIDFIYSEENNSFYEIDAVELFRLIDYLQVSANIITEILRYFISTTNCIKLHELALSCNYLSLQEILESYISNNLKELIGSPAWALSENALSSLQKNPVYLSQPAEIIGADAKEILNNIYVRYSLVSYQKKFHISAKSRTWSVKNDCEMTVYSNRSTVDKYGKQMVYFIFQYELYAIETGDNLDTYWIYKYDHRGKTFSIAVGLSRKKYHWHGILKLPSNLPEVEVSMVITSISEESIFILFSTEDSDVWLMKLNLGKIGRPSIQLENQFVDLDRYRCIVLCRKSLYFFEESGYYAYSLDSRSTKRYELEDSSEGNQSCNYSYCEFQDVLYAFNLMEDHHKLKIFLLDEDDGHWVLLSEHVIESRVIKVHAVSSPNELYLVLNVSDFEDEDESPDYYSKSIYCYNPVSKDLLLLKEFESFDREYLFVPEYMVP